MIFKKKLKKLGVPKITSCFLKHFLDKYLRNNSTYTFFRTILIKKRNNRITVLLRFTIQHYFLENFFTDNPFIFSNSKMQMNKIIIIIGIIVNPILPLNCVL